MAKRHNKPLVDPFKSLGIPDPVEFEEEEYLSTGFSALDNDVIQNGGIPIGHITEIYGEPYSGKTLMCLRLSAMAQRRDERPVVWVDTEFKFDAEWARRQGVDISPSRFRYHTAKNFEELAELSVKYAESGAVSIIVGDSLGGSALAKHLSVEAFKTNNAGEKANPAMSATFAQYVTAWIKAMAVRLKLAKSTLVVVNQVRDKVGVVFGSTETTPGGHAVRHHCDLRIRMRRIGDVKNGEEVVGVKVAVRVVKNGRGVLRATDDSNHPIFMFDGGIEKSQVVSLFDQGLRQGKVVVSGAWVTIYDRDGVEVYKQAGRDKALQALCDSDELRSALEGALGIEDTISDGFEAGDGVPA